eukprot:7024986-Pyramimonas_sp.AAC.2
MAAGARPTPQGSRFAAVALGSDLREQPDVLGVDGTDGVHPQSSSLQSRDDYQGSRGQGHRRRALCCR